jgi:hypothetical protein
VQPRQNECVDIFLARPGMLSAKARAHHPLGQIGKL